MRQVEVTFKKTFRLLPEQDIEEITRMYLATMGFETVRVVEMTVDAPMGLHWQHQVDGVLNKIGDAAMQEPFGRRIVKYIGYAFLILLGLAFICWPLLFPIIRKW